jgi:hypothetical protein
VLECVSGRAAEAAENASDALLKFADSMFDDLEAHIDPALLDAQAAPLGAAGVYRATA